MEILKALSETEIIALREVFEREEEGLDCQSFEQCLTDACKNKPTINLATLKLRELFSEIDSSGDGYVNWDEFTMYIIHRTDDKNKAASGTGLDGIIKNYLLNHVIEHEEIPKSIIDMKYIPKLNKILKVVKQERGPARLRVCQNDFRLTPYFDIPKSPVPDTSAISWEYIPPCHAQLSNCLAVCYNDCVLRIVDMQKRRLTMHNEVRVMKSVKLAESQTVMRWSSRYERLILGSRTGIVSVLHPDESHVYNQEKLHGLLVADMAVDDSLLFTASVDPVDSVKCVDLQRSVVRYALNDHEQGTTHILLNTAFQTLFSVGFELYVVSHAMLMPRVKAWKLYDSSRPHRGRITHMELVVNTPQLLTCDSCGLTKLWDIRMNQCVQNILPPKDELDITPPEQSAASSLCVVASSKRIIINGRNTAIYCYEGAQDPAVADDAPAHIVLINETTQTFATFHQRSVKHWDIATGELTSSYKDIAPADITAAVIAPPMQRKLFVGTVGAHLVKYSFALCEVEADLSHHCSAFKTEEVVEVVPVPNLRESTPYILVAFRRDLLMVPDAEGHSVKPATHITALATNTSANVVIKSVRLARSALVFVGCSDGSVRVIDLNTLALVSSWGHKEVMRGDVVSLSVHPIAGGNSSCMAFCSTGKGTVVCGVTPVVGQWDAVAHWDGTEHCEVRLPLRHDMEGDDGLSPPTATLQHQQHSPAPPSKSPLPQIKPPLLDTPAERGVAGTGHKQAHHAEDTPCCSSLAGSRQGSGRHLKPNAKTPHGASSVDSAVAAYLNPSTRAEQLLLLGSCVVCVQYVSSLQILVTADEKGTVTMWDVRHCAAQAHMFVTDPLNAPLMHSQPLLIRWWRAHDEEITSLALFEDQTTGKLCVVTASNDRRVRVWSADGCLLGNLALGRDSVGTALAEGVEPYTFALHNVSNWAAFDAHMEAYGTPLAVPEAQPMSASLQSDGNSVMFPAAASSRDGCSSAARSQQRPLLSSRQAAAASALSHSETTRRQTLAGSSVGGVPPHDDDVFLTQGDALQLHGGSADPALDVLRGASIDAEIDGADILKRHARLVGLVKPAAALSARWKKDPMPMHLTSHTGVLPSTSRAPVTQRSPRTAHGVGVQHNVRLGQSDERMTSPESSTAFRASPPPPPRLSRGPPSPPRVRESRQSQRLMERCKQRRSIQTAEDELMRRGRVILGDPGDGSPLLYSDEDDGDATPASPRTGREDQRRVLTSVSPGELRKAQSAGDVVSSSSSWHTPHRPATQGAGASSYRAPAEPSSRSLKLRLAK